MQIRDDNVNETKRMPGGHENNGDGKGNVIAGIFRALKIFAFFVVLVVIFIASVMVVAIASGASLGSCSSGSQNPVV